MFVSCALETTLKILKRLPEHRPFPEFVFRRVVSTFLACLQTNFVHLSSGFRSLGFSLFGHGTTDESTNKRNLGAAEKLYFFTLSPLLSPSGLYRIVAAARASPLHRGALFLGLSQPFLGATNTAALNDIASASCPYLLGSSLLSPTTLARVAHSSAHQLAKAAHFYNLQRAAAQAVAQRASLPNGSSHALSAAADLAVNQTATALCDTLGNTSVWSYTPPSTP